FFSSRSRHTRFSRDWSSDVCSSDLLQRHLVLPLQGLAADGGADAHPLARQALQGALPQGLLGEDRQLPAAVPQRQKLQLSRDLKIGRASCRERVSVKVAVRTVEKEA